MLLDVICAVLFEKRLSSVFTRKRSRQVESARKFANHPFACNLSRIPICMIFAGLKVILFKRETFVSEFLFKLFDREKVLHNCNRQNIHVAETTCTPASAIFNCRNLNAKLYNKEKIIKNFLIYLRVGLFLLIPSINLFLIKLKTGKIENNKPLYIFL